jgi:hypothetical protein
MNPQPDLTALLRALSDDLIPDLDGALCAGGAPGWEDDLINEDEDAREARHHATATVCAAGPAQAPCAAVRASLGPDTGGVWAGRVYATPWRRKRA